ncbi:branched-chain amino acid ABC transporter permease [Candidatus Cryosericum odellii]|jgi:branched-chain amino acid transport system permease protein|uniref:Branched-chain amino acid ABC transporter permease n=1 Tax=Candidatus Cryosericum odellii TaxID=2290917 RepID=A0A398D086_9BACT|nr:branched-chain amino acid ABC transporter permease [Candidatus Cryosericum odellii]RIE07237.1 branched-chain amino acid ABC transporter permease [Candidatus Cryosericum odellii]RIE08512.1 branched-chain amino acid ABC transporter permease [Candidatus Cryosericum odellii]
MAFLRAHRTAATVIALVLVYIAIKVLNLVGILNAYYIQLLMLVGINIVMTVSLGMVNGFTGQFSIGHAGFMAVGAYTSAMITTVWLHASTANPWVGYPIFIVAILAGGLLAAGAGYLVGAPSLRLKGDYLAIVTLSASELIRTVIRVTNFLGGPRGLGGIPKFTNLEVVFVFATVSVVLMRNYLFSSHGRSMKAVRDSEIAAEATGVNTTKQKVFVFVFSAFFAGVSGGVFAHLLQFIHPDNFTFAKSLEYLIYLYVGGSASISGAMVGAAIFTVLPELLRSLQTWRMVIYPLILILVMIFRTEGVMGLKEFGFILIPQRQRKEVSA